MKHAASSARATRRQFLKASAAAAATLGGLSIDRNAHAGGQEVVRIGLIGCGGRGTGAAQQALQAGPYVKLVAMCDIFADRLQASRKYLKGALPEQVQVADDHCFVDFDGYRNVIDAADVVLIACASKFHSGYAEAAVRAGKHVFVEKPHGIDPVGVRRMQAACDLARQKGLSLVSGLHSRFDRGWQETVQRIQDGAIGTVVAVQAMFLRGPYNLVPRDPALTETEYQFRNWYHFAWLSGDDVTQSLVHNMDRVAWLLHEEAPKLAFGLAGRSSSFGTVYGDMFDHHTVVYEYASGARVYALCRTQFGCYGNSGDVVLGSKGVCHLGRYRIEGGIRWEYAGPRNNPYDDEQRALIESVRSGRPLNSGDHMARSTLAAVMGQLACYTGKPVTWEQVQASTFQFGPPPEESNFQTRPPVVPDPSGNYPLPRPGVTKMI
jgi:predicted dehydrogenase